MHVLLNWPAFGLLLPVTLAWDVVTLPVRWACGFHPQPRAAAQREPGLFPGNDGGYFRRADNAASRSASRPVSRSARVRATGTSSATPVPSV